MRDQMDATESGEQEITPEQNLWMTVITSSIQALRNPATAARYVGCQTNASAEKKREFAELARQYEQRWWDQPGGAQEVCDDVGLDYGVLRERLEAEGLLKKRRNVNV